MITMNDDAPSPKGGGYWAVEIQNRAGLKPRHLCHATDDDVAIGMAKRLGGSSRQVNGFDIFRLAEAGLTTAAADLPGLGLSRPMNAEEWRSVMLMRDGAIRGTTTVTGRRPEPARAN